MKVPSYLLTKIIIHKLIVNFFKVENNRNVILVNVNTNNKS